MIWNNDCSNGFSNRSGSMFDDCYGQSDTTYLALFYLSFYHREV